MDRQLNGEVSQSQLAATVRGGTEERKRCENEEKWRWRKVEKGERRAGGGMCSQTPGILRGWLISSMPVLWEAFPWHNYQQAFLCLQRSQKINQVFQRPTVNMLKMYNFTCVTLVKVPQSGLQMKTKASFAITGKVNLPINETDKVKARHQLAMKCQCYGAPLMTWPQNK